MADQPVERGPSGVWRALRAATAILVALAGVIFALIALGVFDPKPLGPLWRREQPGLQSATGDGPSLLPQPAPWPPEDTPQRYSIRLTAANAGGELDSGYGMVLGDDSRGLFVAVSPLGYAALWEANRDGEPEYRQPWQTWPHVRPGQQANEVWLDVEKTAGGAAVTVWINRELFRREEIDFFPRQAGLWWDSFGGPATVDFQKLEWFATTQG
jgi:hypothetical protein